jgi:phosphoglycerate dehydrogenase-like enzyme
LTGRVKGVDGWIAGLDEIDASVIAAADRLKVIARYGVGVDRVDAAAATARGIVIANTPGANSVAVAELTLGLMLALGRQICPADQAVRDGRWPRMSGVGLAGKTVDLVGFGSSAEVAQLRPSVPAFVADPFVGFEAVSGRGGRLVSLDELLPASDFVCLHVAATPRRRHGERIVPAEDEAQGLSGQHGGELIDETALARSLENGRLRGAALDCFQKEPPGVDHPLLKLPHVIATPHTGAHTDEAVNAMGRMALDACLAVLRGERPAHVVNPEVYRGMMTA